MVKFVCGLQKPASMNGSEPPVKPGNYATAINIHNYQETVPCGTLRPALHYSLEASSLPPVFPVSQFLVAPLSVLEVDCNSLWRLTGSKPDTFLKGMLDLGLASELPVVAVYTAEITDRMGITGTGAGISIDVEYLSPFIH
jgi:hypothetical protein